MKSQDKYILIKKQIEKLSDRILWVLFVKLLDHFIPIIKQALKEDGESNNLIK